MIETNINGLRSASDNGSHRFLWQRASYFVALCVAFGCICLPFGVANAQSYYNRNQQLAAQNAQRHRAEAAERQRQQRIATERAWVAKERERTQREAAVKLRLLTEQRTYAERLRLAETQRLRAEQEKAKKIATDKAQRAETYRVEEVARRIAHEKELQSKRDERKELEKRQVTERQKLASQKAAEEAKRVKQEAENRVKLAKEEKRREELLKEKRRQENSSSSQKIKVTRYMSEAELKATKETGLLRGGREGEHFVTKGKDRYNSASKAQQYLALKDKPQYRVRLEAEKKYFSNASRVNQAYGQPGGGREMTATGKVPVRIVGNPKRL